MNTSLTRPLKAGSVRIWVKKQRVVSHLTFKQFQILKLGTVGLATVKNRVQAGRNSFDAPSKPLKKAYFRKKWKLFKKKPIRDLTLTGAMLNNLQVRTVSNKRAQARNTTVKDRQKANNNERIEPWMWFSPKNQQDIMRAAKLIFGDACRHLIK